MVVTGVQTCALPISQVCTWPVPVSEQLAKAVVEASAKKLTVPVAKGGVATESVTVAGQLVEAPAAEAGGLQLTVVTVGCVRSGERRVGEGCRSRWWRCNLKKTTTGRRAAG